MDVVCIECVLIALREKGHPQISINWQDESSAQECFNVNEYKYRERKKERKKEIKGRIMDERKKKKGE